MRAWVASTRAVALGAAVALSWSSSAPARADGPQAATAEALFEAGRQAMQRGDYDAACSRFAESERLDPAPGTLINVADCEEHRGHLASAWDAWHEALRSLAATDDRLAAVRQRAQALDKRVPRLTVSLRAGAPAGTQVHRDDVELGAASMGVALPVDPGAHTLRAEAPGRAPSSVTVTLAEGDAKTVEISPGDPIAPAPAPAPTPASPPTPAPTPTLAPSPEPPHDSPALRATGWVVGIAGLASLAAGAATGVLALARKSTVQSHCPSDACDATGLDAAQSGHTFATVSDVTFAAGGVLVLAGAYLLWTQPAAPAGATGVAIAPSPAGVSIALRGSF